MQIAQFFALNADEQCSVYETLNDNVQCAIIAALAATGLRHIVVGVELEDGCIAQVVQAAGGYWMLADYELNAMSMAEFIAYAGSYSESDWEMGGWERISEEDALQYLQED